MIVLDKPTTALCHHPYPDKYTDRVVHVCEQAAFHTPPCTPDAVHFRKHRKHIDATSAPLFPDYVPTHRMRTIA